MGLINSAVTGDIDIDRDCAALKSQGVRFFSDVNEVPEGRYVGFQDPDGNLLELIQQ